MIKDVAIITSLFDYPKEFLPTFYKNALKYFKDEDIHIVRNNNLMGNESYYNKLFFYKIPKVLEYIKKNILNKYKYILFLDATDTNFYSSPENIVNDFLKKNCSIVMGAEKELWPPTSYNHLYKNKNINSEYKYLNSGTYFGYSDKIVFHMENIMEKIYDEGIDDQGKWSIEYLLHNDIIIDSECEFFMSTLNSKKFIDVGGSIKILNYTPIIIHDNGPHNENTIKLTNRL
jgi:hypothetical protein